VELPTQLAELALDVSSGFVGGVHQCRLAPDSELRGFATARWNSIEDLDKPDQVSSSKHPPHDSGGPADRGSAFVIKAP
jgi:hypothetical protein